MKKQANLRLKLHRETLRVLASPELEGAQGGAATTNYVTLASCERISCGGTCGCPPHVTITCATVCGGACSATSQTC
jgi:hypothetical protein